MLKVWELFYADMLINGALPLKALYDLPREDSVKRLRAMFTAKGLYYPTTWEVAEARRINEDEWRVATGYPVKESERPSYTPPSLVTHVLTFASKSKPEEQHRVVVSETGIECDCEIFKHRRLCSHKRQALAELQLKFQPALV